MRTFSIKRLRKDQFSGEETWRKIGTVVIGDDGSGSVYLHHIDETYRLYEYAEQPKASTGAKKAP